MKPFLLSFFLMVTSRVAFSENTRIKGQWETACSGSRIIAIEIVNDKTDYFLKVTRSLFSDPKCIRLTEEKTYNYSYETDDSSNDINFTLRSAFFRKVSLNAKDLANENEECGFNDWKLGVPKEITGERDCNGFEVGNAGRTYYNIFEVDSNSKSLRFGLTPDVGTYWSQFGSLRASSRPETLDNGAEYFPKKK